MWAIGLTGVINVLLGLIQVGSYEAFNAIISLVTTGYLSSYLIAICCMIHRRRQAEPINFGPWTLGRWGMAINVYAAAYTLLTVVFAFFPATIPVTAQSMNYSCVVYGGVVILGILFYAVWGHKKYKGPETRLEFVH